MTSVILQGKLSCEPAAALAFTASDLFCLSLFLTASPISALNTLTLTISGPCPGWFQFYYLLRSDPFGWDVAVPFSSSRTTRLSKVPFRGKWSWKCAGWKDSPSSQGSILSLEPSVSPVRTWLHRSPIVSPTSPTYTQEQNWLCSLHSAVSWERGFQGGLRVWTARLEIRAARVPRCLLDLWMSPSVLLLV